MSSVQGKGMTGGQNEYVFNSLLKVEIEVWYDCAILECEATATCWTACRGRGLQRRKQGATASLAAIKEFSIGSVLAAALIRTSCKKNSTRIALNLFFAENVFLFNSGRPWQEISWKLWHIMVWCHASHRQEASTRSWLAFLIGLLIVIGERFFWSPSNILSPLWKHILWALYQIDTWNKSKRM